MTVVNKTVKHCEENGAMKKAELYFVAPSPDQYFEIRIFR